MMETRPDVHCDLMIIGCGMAGAAAALFASARGIDTIQVGMTGELNYASGLIDLLGVHPIAEGRKWDNPWAGIDRLVKDCPRHPYARLERRDMHTALSVFFSMLEMGGLPYTHTADRNLQIITPVGSVKSTYAVPETMKNGVRALEEKAPCLMVDFKGLKGYSSRQIAETLKTQWPKLRAGRLEFPDTGGDLFSEQLARRLDLPETLAHLAADIRGLVGQEAFVGLPAIVGLYKSRTAFEDLQRQIGLPLFEIAVMPPSVAGLRLRHVFEQQLPHRGVNTFFQQKVFSADYEKKRGFRFRVGAEEPQFVVHAKGAVLASGRFFGKGLHADRKEIRETVFGLPVHQTADRTGWHRKRLLDRRGHGINRSGLETDRFLRPLGVDGRPAFPTLHAAGSILAHQDWVRQKCGSGLAITTAYAAVKAFADLLV